MSQVISIRKFILFFTLYVLISLSAYLITANTIAAWIIYLFILVPFYIICIFYLISLSLKYRQKMLIYQQLPLYLSITFQLLMILTSPASCYGFKQGQACYSFIQTHLAGNTTQHWSIIENMFPVTSFLYIISVMAFLKMIQIEKN